MAEWEDPNKFPDPYMDDWNDEEFDDTEQYISPNTLCKVKYQFKDLNVGDLVISVKSVEGWTLVFRKHSSVSEWVPTSYLTEAKSKTKRDSAEYFGMISTNIIRVSGLPERTTRQELITYFENKRKHLGGKILSIELNERLNFAVITFKDNKSAERVMRKLPLKFGPADTQIHVELVPLDDSPTSSDSEETEGTSLNRTIEVRNFPPSTSEQSLQIHFMSSKRSGGGEVESCNIYPEEGYAKITFENEEDMNRVLQRQQIFEDQELLLKVFEPPTPPDCYKNKFFVSGLESDADAKMLKLLFKVKAGLRATVTDIVDGEEDGTALVTCDNDVDIPRMQAAFAGDTENKYKITPVPITYTVEVRNVNPNITAETLKYYFMLPKESGGGEIVEINESEGVFYIQFEDPSCVERICDETRKHKVGGEILQVNPFHACIHGKSDFDIPKAKEIANLEPEKIEFLKLTHPNMVKDLNEHYMKILWPENEDDVLRIECLIKKTQRGSKKLSRQWERNALRIFHKYLDNIYVDVHDNILLEVWDVVWSEMEHLRETKPETYILLPNELERNISIIGHRTSVTEVSKKIRKIIREKEIEWEKKEDDVLQTMKVESYKLKLFKALGYNEELCERFPTLKINLLQEQIDFEGPSSQISDAKVSIHDNMSKFKSAEVGRYSRRFMNFVQKDSVHEYLEDKMMSQNITAVLHYDSTKRLMVYSTSDSNAVDAAHMVKEAIVETNSRKIPENSDCLLSSPELRDKIQELNEQFPGLLETSADFQECSIQIFCVQDNVNSVLEVINEYLTNNILHEQARKKSRGVLRFLYEHRRNEISNLQEELKNNFVEIEIDQTAIYIKGTATGLARAKLRMEQLSRKIVKKKQVFKNPAIISQIGTAQGYEKINSVEEATECIIELATEEEEEEEDDSTGEQDANTSSPKVWAKCQTLSEKNIYCMHGDITLVENVDVIVNAADGCLKMEGGLAKIIKEKGGKEVIEDCKKYITSKGRMYEGDVYCGVPGNLRNQCKSIFHAVGPIYRDGTQNEEDYLREVIFQILENAASKRYRSIVIPAISTGIYNYPLTEAIKVLIESIAEFFEENGNSAVSDVYFCDIDFDVVTKFGDQLKETFGAGSVTFNKQENKLGGWLDFSKGREPKAERPVVSTVLNGTISVQIIRGNIVLQKVDVIVNLTSKELDLEFDPAEIGLLENGGKDLQRQCQSQYPDGIKDNEIALTRGGNLLCKNIFHCYIQQDKNASEAVKEVIDNIIALAHDERFESIAIPPISTGKMKFSTEETANVMLKGFHNFAKQYPKTTVKDIRLVIPEAYVDQIQIYEERLKEYETSMSKTMDSRRNRTYVGDQDMSKDSDVPRKPLLVRPKPIPRSAKTSFNIQTLNLEVSKGDLPSAKADAVIYIHSRKLSLEEGTNLNTFQQKAGEEVAKSINTKLQYLSDKKCFPVVSAGENIPARFIIVVNAAQVSGRDWKVTLMRALQTAEEKGCKTVAFSPFWKTEQKKDIEDAIHKLYDAIIEFQSLPEVSFLKSVQLVIPHQPSITLVLPIIKDTLETRKGRKPGLFSKISSLFGSNEVDMNRTSNSNYQRKSQSQTVHTDSLTTIFYADSMEKIDKAIEELTERFQSVLEMKLFEDKIIKEFSESQIKQIQDLESCHSVDIKVEKRVGRVRVRGMPENVTSASDDINRLLRSFANTTYKEREAKHLLQVIQWCYEEQDDEQPYDMYVNLELENAYLRKDRQKILRFDKGEEYLFDFEEMIEYPVNEPQKIVRIIRRDARKSDGKGFGTVEYPDGWKEMKNLQNVIVVELESTDKDYKEVVRYFNQSIGESQRTIHKIQRIQNKTLYQQYIAKKEQMRKENKNCRKNEQKLWHGTSELSLSSINKRGMNRSYCGKHATLYGQGIYFAASSEYSAQDTYSPPSSSSGFKYVYLCHVLTGEYTKGASGMRVPPAKPAAEMEDCLYDSVVDNEEQPSIFVIFNDTQAYPAFLVTFK